MILHPFMLQMLRVNIWDRFIWDNLVQPSPSHDIWDSLCDHGRSHGCVYGSRPSHDYERHEKKGPDHEIDLRQREAVPISFFNEMSQYSRS